MLYRGSKQLVVAVLAVLLSLPVIANISHAQTVEATTTTELPAQLTREAVDQFLGQLSDKEVRQALRKQLVAVADKQAAEASEVPTTVEFFGNALAAGGNSIYQATIRIPNIGSGLARAWNVFLDGRGFSGFLLFLVKAGALFGAGYLVMRGFDILTRGFRRTIHESPPTSLVGTTKVLFLRLGLDLVRIAGIEGAWTVPSSGILIWKSDNTSSRKASNSSSARSISSINNTGD